MELARRFSIYKRGEPLASHYTSSNAARGLVSRPKNRPARPIWGAPRPPPCPSRTPIFRFSTPFLKIFSPRLPSSVRRALNRLAALSPSPKTLEFRGKTAHSRLAAAPILPVKHCPRTPKNPPLTPLRTKKLSKVRSTLLTPLPEGCILEYMRLKEPRRPPHTGGTRSTDRLQNFQTNPPRIRRSGALTPKE